MIETCEESLEGLINSLLKKNNTKGLFKSRWQVLNNITSSILIWPVFADYQ